MTTIGTPPRAAAPRWWARAGAPAWRSSPIPAEVRGFHASLPGYAPTALVELPSLAVELGVGRCFVKDESARFGLPAFKALGATWAVHRALAERARGPSEGASAQHNVPAAENAHITNTMRYLPMRSAAGPLKTWSSP